MVALVSDSMAQDKHDLRRSSALIAAFMPASWALRRPLSEKAVALLALPTYYASRLSPDASKLLKLLRFFDIVLAISSGIPRIARRPFAALGGLSRTLGASNVIARLASGCCGGNEKCVALMAGAPDTLCCWLVCELVAIPGGESQDLLLFRLLPGLFDFLSRSLLLGVSRALLAALMFTLHADLVVAVKCTAFVAASVDAHADGLLYAWYHRSRGTCSEQVI